MRIYWFTTLFLLISAFCSAQTNEEDGYIIGFNKQDSAYSDFQVLRTEFQEWHKLGKVLDELYGLNPNELSEATVICDKRFKVYDGWKLVSEIDLANPRTTIADGKDNFTIFVKYRKGGSENFADQSSTTTANAIIINVSPTKDGVGQKTVTVCYPSSKYENEVAGDLSANRTYHLTMHEYPIFVNIHGIQSALEEAQNLQSFEVYWDAAYINKAVFEYFTKKGKSINEKEKSLLIQSAYKLGLCYIKLGMYNKALIYLTLASNNSTNEKNYLECNFQLAQCLEKLKLNSADIYEKMILHQQNTPELDAKQTDFVLKAYLHRAEIFIKQKNATKAKEYIQKLSSLDTSKRYSANITKLNTEISKLSN